MPKLTKYSNSTIWTEMKFGLKGEVFVRDKANVVSRVGGVVYFWFTAK